MAKLRIIFSKTGFKAACVEAGIRVPCKYEITSPVKFPVIVKPADNGGSRGITICHSHEELLRAYDKAKSFSDSGEILIEEYITADEIRVYFTVHNGEATLSAMCDRYMHRFHENITQLPIGYYYPSKHLGTFIEYNLEKFRRLIRLLDITDGLIAFQSFVVGNDVIPFDPTFRLDGTMAYHMIEHRNGINVVELLIRKSLAGTMGDDDEIRRLENPYFSAPTFELPILLGRGIVSKVEGLEYVEAMPDVIFVSRRDKVLGAVMENEADFTQIAYRIHICADDNASILRDIHEIFSRLRITDENGRDMIIWRGGFDLP